MTLTCAHPCHSHGYRLEPTGGIVGDIDMCTSMSFPWVQTGADRRIVGDIYMHIVWQQVHYCFPR